MQETAPSPTQPELFAIEQVQGYGALKPRERLFVQEILAGATQRQAIKTAGFIGTPESLDVTACRLIKSAKVRAVIDQAWKRNGADIDETLRQATHLQALAYHEAHHAETAERRKLAAQQWREASALIASIHGKLSLRVDGDVNVRHSGQIGVTLPPEACAGLAQMRREALLARGQQPVNTGGEN